MTTTEHKPGDTVWVHAKVAEVDDNLVRVTVRWAGIAYRTLWVESSDIRHDPPANNLDTTARHATIDGIEWVRIDWDDEVECNIFEDTISGEWTRVTDGSGGVDYVRRDVFDREIAARKPKPKSGWYIIGVNYVDRVLWWDADESVWRLSPGGPIELDRNAPGPNGRTHLVPAKEDQ